jgi:hypothetical protein
VSLPDRYIQWNRAITEKILLDSFSDQVYLTITPRILAAAISQFSNKPVSPEEAEENFVEVVSEVYRTQVLQNGLTFVFQTKYGQDLLPKCIGFLAFSVLAAYKMHSDEEGGANAYYKRLAGLLSCQVDGIYPEGFDPHQFEGLWKFLAKELRCRERELEMPGADTGSKRYVAYPLTHVPLRQLDVEKLPEFFAWAGYQPESRIPEQNIDTDLSRWGKLPYTISKPGQAALSDNRRKAAISEIAQELELWDGSVNEPMGSRSAIVEVLLDFPKRQPQLFYLPRRPLTFPNDFKDGLRHFKGGLDGWYNFVPIPPEDGHLLLKELEWKTQDKGKQFILRRSRSSAFSLVPSRDFAGFQSHQNLLLGVSCSALVHESLLDKAVEYFNTVSTSPPHPKKHQQLPRGWYLFHNIKVDRYTEYVPDGLEFLSVESTTEITAVGGLRLGRKSEWMACAPPRLILTGIERVNEPMIDGQVVAVSEDRSLADKDHRLHIPGTHSIKVGSVNKRIEIVEPDLAKNLVRWNISDCTGPPQLVLPQGSWRLIGAVPGEIARASSDSWSGFVPQCQFLPVWAVSLRRKQEAKAICLMQNPPVPKVSKFVPKQKLDVERWVSLIHDAGVESLYLATLCSEQELEQLRDIWKSYEFAAGQIKLKWKFR